MSESFHSVCLSSSVLVTIKCCQCINRQESSQRLQQLTDSVHYPESTSCLISHLTEFNLYVSGVQEQETIYKDLLWKSTRVLLISYTTLGIQLCIFL